MSDKFKIFQEYMMENWCYCCDADEKGDCDWDNPKCIAFIFKYARRAKYWSYKKQKKMFEKFFSEWEQFKEELQNNDGT